MKFKLFGIIWDLRVPLGAIWAFIGMMLIGLSFWLDKMGWWMVPYFVLTLTYLATAEGVAKKLKGYDDESN
jgi:hypothetical protein